VTGLERVRTRGPAALIVTCWTGPFAKSKVKLAVFVPALYNCGAKL